MATFPAHNKVLRTDQSVVNDADDISTAETVGAMPVVSKTFSAQTKVARTDEGAVGTDIAACYSSVTKNVAPYAK